MWTHPSSHKSVPPPLSGVCKGEFTSAHLKISLCENSRGVKTILEIVTLIQLLVLFELCQATASL